MRCGSESASKNRSKPIFKYPKYSNIRIFENSLASDLVFVSGSITLNCKCDYECAPEEFSEVPQRSWFTDQRDESTCKLLDNITFALL